MLHLSHRQTNLLPLRFLIIGMLVWAAQLAVDLPHADALPQESSPIQGIEIGFAGKVVLGKWVPFTVETDASIQNQSLQVETRDGDAIPVVYESGSAGQGNQQGLIRMGRAAGVTVRVVDESGAVVESRRFSLEELQETHSFLPGTTKLTLYLGLEREEQQSFLELDRQLSDETAVVTDYEKLPAIWTGYDSLRTVIMAPVSGELASVSAARMQALDRWIRQGGRMVLTGGNAIADLLANRDSLFTPGTFQETESITDSGSVELFAGANEQLVSTGGTPLPVTVIKATGDYKTDGTVGEHPLIYHWMHGFGRVSFICLDFTAQPLSDWDERRRLLTLTIDDTGIAQDDAARGQTGRVSHIGFTDISGQLRAALDQFGNVSFVTFTMVALLIGLFILAIGPGDFFFLRKVTGRMELTWVTFTMICLGFCGLAWFLSSQLKSSETELNQVEIIDVDTFTNEVRGHLWSHIYSPKTGSYDVAMPDSSRLFGELDEAWVTWQGLPGRGMGSMQSRSDLGLFRRQYQCRITEQGSSLHAIPMQNASTRTFFGNWTAALPEPVASGLRQSANSDALLGTVTNPLDRDLYECVILYGDWVYELPNRPLDAGETIVVEDDLREKTITGHYTRFGGRGEDQVSAAWDLASIRLPRIAQMMSFFDVIGGESYTRLTNDFHSNIDLSQQLKMGRAVLVGQFRQAPTPLKVNGQEFENYDKRFALIRIVLPVQPRK